MTNIAHLGSLGMDECFGDNFLNEPNFATVPETKWVVTGDFAGPNGQIQVTVTDAQDADLGVFFVTTGELRVAKGSAVIVGDIFKVAGTGDTTDNALEAAKGSAVAANDMFVVTNIVTEAVVFVGNKVAVYAFSIDQTSKLAQTSANRANIGVDIRAYVFTYDIVHYTAPDGVVFTLEGFGNSVVLPHTSGAQEVIFAAPAGASLADFEIRAVSSGATVGIITFDNLVLRGIVKKGITPSKSSHNIPFSGIWGGIQALDSTVVVSALGRFDTGLTSLTMVRGNIVVGRFVEIRPTVGSIVAYRVTG